MRHFKNPITNEVFGYDETQDEYIQKAIEAGYVEIEWPMPLTDEQKQKNYVLGKISTLEAKITPRRLRDSVLTEPGKQWLQSIENEINTLRNQL